MPRAVPSGSLDGAMYFTGSVKRKHSLLPSSETVRNIQSGISYLPTFQGLAWRTRAPSPWNSTQRITSGSRLSQAELHSNWRMEKRCQRPSCLLPPPTVSSLSGKWLVNHMAEVQLRSPCPFPCPSCPELPQQHWADPRQDSADPRTPQEERQVKGQPCGGGLPFLGFRSFTFNTSGFW